MSLCASIKKSNCPFLSHLEFLVLITESSTLTCSTLFLFSSFLQSLVPPSSLWSNPHQSYFPSLLSEVLISFPIVHATETLDWHTWSRLLSDSRGQFVFSPAAQGLNSVWQILAEHLSGGGFPSSRTYFLLPCSGTTPSSLHLASPSASAVPHPASHLAHMGCLTEDCKFQRWLSTGCSDIVVLYFSQSWSIHSPLFHHL